MNKTESYVPVTMTVYLDETQKLILDKLMELKYHEVALYTNRLVYSTTLDKVKHYVIFTGKPFNKTNVKEETRLIINQLYKKDIL